MLFRSFMLLLVVHTEHRPSIDNNTSKPFVFQPVMSWNHKGNKPSGDIRRFVQQPFCNMREYDQRNSKNQHSVDIRVCSQPEHPDAGCCTDSNRTQQIRNHGREAGNNRRNKCGCFLLFPESEGKRLKTSCNNGNGGKLFHIERPGLYGPSGWFYIHVIFRTV